MLNKLTKTALALAIAELAMPSAALAQEAANPNVVVVTGQRAALQSAQKIKQDADEVVDSIVAEDIGKLPERSVTEVLSRIPGVTMERNQVGDPQHYAVEGSGVSIRGMTYIRSELNGRESFSAGGGRGLSFSDVPPELMAGVDVYKNPSAEQIEGGVSGLVNLRTAMPFDLKGFKGAVSYQKSYSKLRKGRASPSGSLLLSDRWKTPLGEFGALISLASSESNTRTDAMSVDAYYPLTTVEPGQTRWVPRGTNWRSQLWERDRKGAYAALQWRPMRDLTASLTWFKSEYEEGWSERVTQTNLAVGEPYKYQVSNATWGERGEMRTGTLSIPNTPGIPFSAVRRVTSRDSSTTDLALNVNWRVSPSWTLRADAQRVRADTEGFESEVATGLYVPSQTMDYTGKFPRVVFDQGYQTYLANPANYFWAHTMPHRDRSDAEAKALRLDARYDFDHNNLRDLRFGVRFTDRESLNRTSVPNYGWVGVTPPWMLGWRLDRMAHLNDPAFPLGKETSLHNFPNFFSGGVSVPGMIFPNDSINLNYPDANVELHGYHDILCQERVTRLKRGSCPAPWKIPTFGTDPAGDNLQTERTKAAYAQLRFGFDQLRFPIDGNIGLRYVQTNRTAFGYTVFQPSGIQFGSGATVVGAELIPDIAPFSTARNYDDRDHHLLPTLNLRLKASDELQFRVAMGRSISQPSFNNLRGYTSLSRGVNQTTSTVGGVTTTTVNSVNLTGRADGNPNLKPVMADSIDLTGEWYFAKSGSLTGALFYKKLRDIVTNQRYLYDVVDRQGNTHQFDVTGPVNGADGRVRGFELAYQSYFDNLPEVLKGLGVRTSFTFVDSQRNLKNPVSAEYCTGNDAATNFNMFMNGCDTNGRSFSGLPLQGLSRRTINFAIMYDRKPVSARLAYNWRSKYLLGVANHGTRGLDATDSNPASPNFGKTNVAWGLPRWQAPYGQLDGSIFFKVTPKLEIGLEAQNLTDATSKQLMQQGIGEMGHNWFVTGPRYTIQAQYSF